MERKQKRLLGAIVLCMVLLVVGYTQREDLKALAWDLKYSSEFRQIKQEILEQYPQLEDENTSDFEKTSLLRDWPYGKYCVIGNVKEDFYSVWSGEHTTMENFVDATPAFQELRGAGQCGGAAAYLVWLYDLFGYEAMSVDYYNDLGMSHVITLVQIQQDGQEIWIYQDATFNRTYVDSSGEPLDCFTITQLLKEGRDGELVESFGDTQYRYAVYDTPPSIPVPENSAEILPNTMDYYPAKNNQFLRCEERYGCLIDMRQPVAMEKNIQSLLNEALNPLGYPGKLNYLYLFPYAYYVQNTEEARFVFEQLQQIAGYEPPVA